MKTLQKVNKVTPTRIKISLNNKKLGNIPSFSISAISSCPGASSWCKKLCYASKIERIYKNAAKAYDTNFDLAKSSKDFVLLMNAELAKLKAKGKVNSVFRIHVSGDFYDVKYIYDWVNIVKSNPQITFYAYTRSWNMQELIPHLDILGKLDNMILFASTDVDTANKIPNGWREAYAGDAMPQKNKMIFCLEQAGKVNSCDQCRLCFNPNSSLNIYFKTH